MQIFNLLTLNLLLVASLLALAPGPALPTMGTVHQEEARYP